MKKNYIYKVLCPAIHLTDNMGLAYKYRAFDRNALSILIDQELYFAKPSSLNDPHDCQIDVIKALNDAIRRWNMEKVPDDRSPGIINTLKQITSNENNIATRLRQSVENNGICSMSATEKNAIMWSHYADEHKGMCFGFNGFKIKERSKGFDIISPSPVFYFDENPMYRAVTNFINMYYYSSSLIRNSGEKVTTDTILPGAHILILDAQRCALSSKSLAWSYEEEWRYIRSVGEGTIRFNHNALKEVIFGCRMSDRDKQTALQLLKEKRWKNVKVKECIKDDYSPTFNIVDVVT